MKHFAAILLTATLLLIGCTDSSPLPEESVITPSETVRGLYVFRTEQGEPLSWHSYGMPLKINLLTGQTTTVCLDPLCMHDSEDCPFFSCSGSMADGEFLFYRRGDLVREEGGYSGSESLCTYNVLTGEAKLLETYPDSLIFAGIHGDYLYYYTAIWANDGPELSCTYHLWRADGRTGKILSLPLDKEYRSTGGWTNNADYPNIHSFDGETITWRIADDTQPRAYRFYTTDLTGENRRDFDPLRTIFGSYCRNGKEYTVKGRVELADPAKRGEAAVMQNDLYQSTPAEDELVLVAEDIGAGEFQVTDRYIYYMDSENIQQKGAYTKLIGCRIWRMEHDGTAREMIAQNDELQFRCELTNHQSTMLDVKTDGETDYIAFSFWTTDENNKAIRSPDTLILNASTGSWTISKWVN